jgi:hypothetical protein
MSKPAYTLLNKNTGVRLTHPRVGLWYTFDFEEAEEMHKACVESMTSMGLADLAKEVVIIDIETGDEFSRSTVPATQDTTWGCAEAVPGTS